MFFYVSFAIKKLKIAISSEMRKDFLDCNEFREAKLLHDLAASNEFSEFIVRYEDCFFDKENYFYLVSEFCQVNELLNYTYTKFTHSNRIF